MRLNELSPGKGAKKTGKRHAIGAEDHFMGVPLRCRHRIGARQGITTDDDPQEWPACAVQGGQREKQPQSFGKDGGMPHRTLSFAENSSAKAGLSDRRSASSKTARAMRRPGEPAGLCAAMTRPSTPESTISLSATSNTS